MKRKISIILVSLIMLIMSSCEGPDALVINIVREDGSFTRKVILTYTKDEFDLDNCQVPVDSTWNIIKEYDISEKGDTTYTLTAVRDFDSVEELNRMYDNYEGSNKGMKRRADFQKKFMWFNNLYRYTEHVDKAMNGYPPEDFYTEEELVFFYMPEKLIEARLEKEDSTQVKRNIIEPMEDKFDTWLGRSLVKVLIDKISDTVRSNPAIGIDTTLLYEKEEEIASSLLIISSDEKEVLDSLMGSGFYESNSVLIDSIMSDVEEEFDVAFNADAYLIQTIMPGRLMATNGFVDEQGNVLWEVDGDVILSSDYDMWAESKVRNTWAWIITFVFLAFVISGLIIRVFRK